MHPDALEIAGKMVDKHIIADSYFPSLINLMRYNVQGKRYLCNFVFCITKIIKTDKIIF